MRRCSVLLSYSNVDDKLEGYKIKSALPFKIFSSLSSSQDRFGINFLRRRSWTGRRIRTGNRTKLEREINCKEKGEVERAVAQETVEWAVEGAVEWAVEWAVELLPFAAFLTPNIFTLLTPPNSKDISKYSPLQ